MYNQVIEKTEEYVRNQLGEDETGHDWFHIDRVRRNSLHICKEEKAGEAFVIEMAALLHDIPDEKLNDSIEKVEEKLDSFLQTIPLADKDKEHIKQIIATISFKGGKHTLLFSIEAE
ncbi:MAG: phosphohydrolase, partial [Bacillus sp. (in: firmicutes)]